MTETSPSALLHIVGHVTGAVLYGMLLVMVARPPARPEVFAVATGLLGLIWNLGELSAYTSGAAGLAALPLWAHALSFAALGLLAAVVVHSVAVPPAGAERWQRLTGRGVAVVVYGCAAVAGALHLRAAVAGVLPPSPAGLALLTVGLVAAMPALVPLTRQSAGTRALWMAALAIVAVSALHLGRFHGAQESWPVELVGHHASLVLAFAILYQDYRFALADLFLKQALALLVLVALAFGSFAVVEPLITTPTRGPLGVAALLGLWIATALLFPACRRLIVWFVDRVVLHRADYQDLLGRLRDRIEPCDSSADVLDATCQALAPALTATSVSWVAEPPSAPGAAGVQGVEVWTAEPPRYRLVVGRLAGGRRLLSDDLAMLERAALLAARQIDRIRLTSERYERVLREREIRALATEAELRTLRAQINPHFLFNALTTIGYLIQHAPRQALATLLDLTNLLRSVLRSEGQFTTLGRERELVECYLKIEQARFEERLTVAIDIPSALEHLQVPALIVQPLVENAVKHGIGRATGGGHVSVQARLADALTIVVRNTGAPLGAGQESGPGVGLDNVERRLAYHYGQAAHLTLRSDPDGSTVAELRLPGRLGDEPHLIAEEAAAR